MNANNAQPRTPAATRAIPLFQHLVLGEIVMALEELGIFDRMSTPEAFTAAKIAATMKLEEAPLAACCEYLVSAGLFRKDSAGAYSLVVGPYHFEWYGNFLLAYREVFESLAPLLTGEKRYGRDVVRRGIFLKNTGAYARAAVAFLVQRFRELGVRSATDIGCGGGDLLFALSRALPTFSGIGIDIDRPTVLATNATFAASEYRNRISIFEGDGQRPDLLPKETDGVDAVVSIGVFHEFRKNDLLPGVLRGYKARFPSTRLFLTELDIPTWEELRAKPNDTVRIYKSFYKITHVFSDQGRPQPKTAWIDVLQGSGWRVINAYAVSPTLVVYECV